MTQDQVIAAAREAGFVVQRDEWVTQTMLRTFYSLAYRQGMERAAEICDGLVAATSNYPEAYEGLTAETKFARGVGECLVVFPNAIRAEAHAKNQPESTHDGSNVQRKRGELNMTAQHTPGRLRWKKEPQETGLAAIGRDSRQRPSKLHDGATEYATVYSYGYNHRAKSDGWYWVAFNPVPYMNTCDEPVGTEAEAKAAALAYVRAAIQKATNKEQA